MPEIAEKDLLQQFASDNYAGICPEAWRAMNAANRGRGSGRRLTFTVVQNTRGRSLAIRLLRLEIDFGAD